MMKILSKKIKDYIKPELNIKNNVGKFFNLFIDKVFVSKIDNDRKHLKLQVIFNFKRENEEFELDLNKKDSGNHSNGNNHLNGSKINLNSTTNRNYSMRASFDNNFLRQKYLLTCTHQPRIC